MKRFVSGFFAILLAFPANADPDSETVADYASRGVEARTRYAAYIASVLRENHPKLTGDEMQNCLDGIAAEPNALRTKLKSAVVMCANLPEKQ